MAGESETKRSLLPTVVLWLITLYLALYVAAVFIQWFAHNDVFRADLSAIVNGTGETIRTAVGWLSFKMPQHLATLTVGTIALVIGLLGWNQKRRADNKSEWWRRTQYAIELTVTNEKEDAMTGVAMIKHLGKAREKRRVFTRTKKRISDDDDIELLQVIALELKRQGSTLKMQEPDNARRENNG